MKNFVRDFKAFIAKGNVLDMAVGVIIGGAFGKIVTSLVENIVMPLFGVILGGLDFTSLSFKIKDATITYGIFLQSVLDFLIIAFCIFVFIKIIGRYRKKAEVKDSKEIVLLTEIRDLLKDRK